MVPNGWNLITLDELKSDKLSYGANSPSCELKENGARYIRITDIDDLGNLNSSAVGIDSDDYEDYILEDKDFLFARSGNTVGKTFLYEKDKHPKAAYAGYLIRYRANKEKLNPQYLKQFCFSNRYHFWIKSQIRAGAQPNINAKEYGSLELPLPPLPEQRKIAQILSTWDRGIATTEKLIDASKQQKKALMQQLLTGKKRLVDPETGKAFEGEWKFSQFNELYKVANNKATQVKSGEYLESGRTPIVDQGKSIVGGYTNNEITYKDLPVIVFGDHTRIVKWVDFEFAQGADGTQVLKSHKSMDDKFAYYVLLNTDIPNLGYSRHMRELKERDFKYPISKVEQQKIASVLTATDKEIELLEAKLAHFKQEKKALMQQLLTGKRRVKVDEDIAA